MAALRRRTDDARWRSTSIRGCIQSHGWSRCAYEIRSKDGTKKNIDMGIVGKDTVDGEEAYWWEIAITSERWAARW